MWIISPDNYYIYVVYALSNGVFLYNDRAGVSAKYAVNPVFYLNSNITLTGNGTSTDPYIPTLS